MNEAKMGPGAIKSRVTILYTILPLCHVTDIFSIFVTLSLVHVSHNSPELAITATHMHAHTIQVFVHVCRLLCLSHILVEEGKQFGKEY